MCSIRAVRHAWCTQWCNRHNDHVSLLRLWGAWENCCSTKMLDMQKLEKLCEKLKLQNDCNRALETKPKTYDPKVLTNLPRPSMQHPLFYLRFPFVHALGLLDSWTLGLLDEMSQNSSNTFKDYIQRCSNLWKSLFQQEIRIKVQPDPEYSNMLKWWGVPTSWGKRNGHRVKLSRAESSWVKLTNSSHLVTEFLPDSDPPVTRCLFANQPPATYGKAQSGRILAWLGWWYLRAGFSHPAKHAVYCA